jgi:hypothetical protein
MGWDPFSHIRYIGCAQRAPAKCALEHGCEPLDHLAPTKAFAVGFWYDHDVGTFQAIFPDKGQLIEQHGVDSAPFEAHMATVVDTSRSHSGSKQ